MTKPLTDMDPMPFGKYEGIPMQDVPSSYLIWLKTQGCDHPGVAGYIKNSWTQILADCPDYIEDTEDGTKMLINKR